MATWLPKARPWARPLAWARGGLLAALAGGLLLALLAGGYYTDWLWFDSLGYTAVYRTTLVTQAALFAAGSGLFLALFAGNVALARRWARRAAWRAAPADEGLWAYLHRLTAQLDAHRGSPRAANAVILAVGALCALLLGLNAASAWLVVLRWLHGRPFGVSDPLFGQDVAFYVFTLPLLRLVHGWLTSALLLTIGGTLAAYAVALVYELRVDLEQVWRRVDGAARAHWLVLAAALLVLLATDALLDLCELVHHQRGLVAGATYADVHAQVPAQWALCGLALLAALLALATIFQRSYRLLLLGIGGWAVAAVLLGNLYPYVVQQLAVRPNELAKELPYLDANIQATLRAYGLTDLREVPFPAADEVTPAAVRANPQTLQNIRLWDPRPLLATYNQVQSIRPYYTFRDIDVDRYVIDGQYQQVMLSVRELAPQNLPPQAQTWVNQRLVYTHGYGVAMSPVAVVGPEGLPAFYLKDVPPTGVLPLTRPEVYYGESDPRAPSGYVVVGTATPEFDYPLGDDNAQTIYQERSGVRLDSPLRRLAYAWQFHDANLLLNTDLRPDSQLLYRRDIRERVATLAPFLRLDSDPYIVIADGRLVWVLDAYTWTDRYPYSQPFPVNDTYAQPLPPGDPRRRFNYIRNSVKITVDAYNGATTFYVADPTDPLVQTYQAIFPTLFQPLDAMPASLRAHLRYPEDLFRIQAVMLLAYHMQNPVVFYNREDVWSIPHERFGDNRQPIEPYYTLMRLPDGTHEEFVLMLPLAPANRENLIAWLAVRNDPPHYGSLLVYKYPKDKLIYGPFQVETRIDQDPAIAPQLTLWNQSGSRVIRGNLLVIPVGNSNLYVEPIYLQAAQSPLPELKRVVVATGNRLAMEPTLDAALARLFGTSAGGTPAAGSTTGTAPLSPAAAALVRQAQQHYQRAQEALRAGDWARYGEELRALEGALQQLVDLTGR
ncbi:MAG TPA: UPF0182 family protein [Chloroflexota bacterium]|nr:UPF0182 family protein [Chloroflexota bacterium]